MIYFSKKSVNEHYWAEKEILKVGIYSNLFAK